LSTRLAETTARSLPTLTGFKLKAQLQLAELCDVEFDFAGADARESCSTIFAASLSRLSRRAVRRRLGTDCMTSFADRVGAQARRSPGSAVHAHLGRFAGCAVELRIRGSLRRLHTVVTISSFEDQFEVPAVGRLGFEAELGGLPLLG
jgi:hypothetical protein